MEVPGLVRTNTYQHFESCFHGAVRVPIVLTSNTVCICLIINISDSNNVGVSIAARVRVGAILPHGCDSCFTRTVRTVRAVDNNLQYSVEMSSDQALNVSFLPPSGNVSSGD